MSEIDLDTWLEGYEPVTTQARIVQKAGLIAEHSRLERAFVAAQQDAADVMSDGTANRIAGELRAIEAEIARSEKVFTFKSQGHETWQGLKRKHPPKPGAAQGYAGEVDIDTFAPEAIAVYSLEPKITLQQAQTLMRKLPPGEYGKLYEAVLEANGEVVGPPKSVLAALTERLRQSVAFSTTEPNEASPVDDYSDTLADRLPES
jgi:hypothetical protein